MGFKVMKIYLIGSYNRFEKCVGVKIGMSACPSGRVKQLQTGSGETLKLIAHWDAPGIAKKVESEAHHKFRNHRKEGEWFYAKKLDKMMFWLCARLDSGPSFIDGDLCTFWLDLARIRNSKRGDSILSPLARL